MFGGAGGVRTRVSRCCRSIQAVASVFIGVSRLDVKCSECGATFDKEDKEYRRQIKKNPDVNFFCNLSCTAKYRNRNLTGVQHTRNVAHLANIQNQAVANAALVNFKGHFTYYLRKARHRTKDTNLDEVYLSDLWQQFDGKCALSGVELILHNGRGAQEDPLRTASLDRIDSKIGYYQGNVQFVAMPLNYAKHNYEDAKFRAFLTEVAKSILA